MTKEKFFYRRWYNWLKLGLGLPILVFGLVFLSTDAMSDFSGFVAMVIGGAVY